MGVPWDTDAALCLMVSELIRKPYQNKTKNNNNKKKPNQNHNPAEQILFFFFNCKKKGSDLASFPLQTHLSPSNQRYLLWRFFWAFCMERWSEKCYFYSQQLWDVFLTNDNLAGAQNMYPFPPSLFGCYLYFTSRVLKCNYRYSFNIEALTTEERFLF